MSYPNVLVQDQIPPQQIIPAIKYVSCFPYHEKTLNLTEMGADK